MEKGLLFFTLSMLCLWVILDDFFGSKKLSGIAQNLTPNIKSPGEAVSEFVEGTATKKEMKSKENDIKKSIDKNKNMNPKAKDALKDSVNHFYDNAEFFKNGSFKDGA